MENYYKIIAFYKNIVRINHIIYLNYCKEDIMKKQQYALFAGILQ